MQQPARQSNSHVAVIITAAFALLTMTACRDRDQWLHCQESRAWEEPKTQNSFYLNIKRSNEEILGQYIDELNSSPAKIKENPVTLTATTNIKQHPGQKGVVQVTYAINKENLKFSKTTRNWISNQFGKPENLGGIKISEAGRCQSGKKPSSRL
jgi:hypothetical protein